MASRQDVIDAKFTNCKVMQEHRKPTRTIAAGAAEVVILATDAPVIICDPGGGAIDLLLPAEADSVGLTFVIINSADAAEAITVKDDSDTNTIVTLDQSQSAYLVCDGTTWRGLIGGIT